MNVEPWALAPTPAMDEVTFKSDTVLSDVHLYTPNQRHLMVRLNGMGQPGKALGACRVDRHPTNPILFSTFLHSSFLTDGKTSLFNCYSHTTTKCPCFFE